MDDKLRLNDFKDLYRALKRDAVWFNHLLFALIIWLEEFVIAYRVQEAVKDAIEEYELIDSPVVSLPQPVYSEKLSETSTRLPEMRLTAPWYKESS